MEITLPKAHLVSHLHPDVPVVKQFATRVHSAHSTRPQLGNLLRLMRDVSAIAVKSSGGGGGGGMQERGGGHSGCRRRDGRGRVGPSRGRSRSGSGSDRGGSEPALSSGRAHVPNGQRGRRGETQRQVLLDGTDGAGATLAFWRDWNVWTMGRRCGIRAIE